MKAGTLKAEALCFLRYVKKCDYVATEVGRFNADVFGVSDGFTIEIETKISVADFKADFRKPKHISYKLGVQGIWVPSYMYFMIPGDIREKCEAILEERGIDKYGLLCYEDNRFVLDGRRSLVVKRAQRLHTGKPRDKLREYMVARMSSEICGTKLMMDRWGTDLSDLISNGYRGIMGTVDRVLTAPAEDDPEEIKDGQV